MVLLPETNREQAMFVAERLRRDIAAMSVSADGNIVRFTISIGVAQLGVDGDTPENCIRIADNHLYEAKQSGRNRVSASIRS